MDNWSDPTTEVPIDIMSIHHFIHTSKITYIDTHINELNNTISQIHNLMQKRQYIPWFVKVPSVYYLSHANVLLFHV